MADTHPASPTYTQIEVIDEEFYLKQQDVPRTPRRTPMACSFCRGRKLKCDGVRPSCSNCNKRNNPCNYQPVSAQKA